MMFENGTRRQSHRIDVIRNGAIFSKLESRDPPTVTMSIDGEIKKWMSASFAPNDQIDPLNDFLRPYLILDGVEYPMGEYMISRMSEVFVKGAKVIQVECHDRALRLAQSRLEERLYIEAGTSYMNAVLQMLTQNDITYALAEANDTLIQIDREDWEIGTPHITIINDLLREINYESIWFDNNGAARLGKIRQLSASAIAHRYAADKFSVISPGYVRVLDTYDAPNVFMAMVSSPDYDAPIVATSVNDYPYSAISTVARNRRILSKIENLNSIASAEELQEYVDNLRAESLLSTEIVQIGTANMPGHEVGDIIALENNDLSGIFKETAWTMVLQAGAQMEHTVKRMVFV